MAVFNVHDAKTHLSRLLERVAQGEEIIIAKSGRPIAEPPLSDLKRSTKIKTGENSEQMLTFTDISAPDGYIAVPQIPGDQVQILWHVDFWDGPRSGVLLYRDERYWFEVVAENDSDGGDWYRRFAVVRLTAQELAEEQRWEQLFREKVGYNPELQPRERWHEFYNPYKSRTPLDLSRNEVLGWFES
jgi:antitoxin (DNA-binding transcriptional repressor) of toxin-antitoxin stability system